MSRLALPDRLHCEDQALLCEHMADEARDPRLAAEWRLMAQDWRAAAWDAANENAGVGAAEQDAG